MDWITLTIEAIGLAILLAWVVVPVQEFRQILRVVGRKHRAGDARAAEAPTPAAGSPSQPGHAGKRGPLA